jgi:hypothetical protein
MHHEAHSAEIDGVKAATTTRTIVEEKRIVSEDVIWDQICLKVTPCFYIPNNVLPMFMGMQF